jgi:hypothetical protein
MAKFAVFIEIEDIHEPGFKQATTTEISEAVVVGVDKLFEYSQKLPNRKVEVHLVKPEEVFWQQGHLNTMTARSMARAVEANERAIKASTKFRAARTGMQL